ncbi:MAG: hypothetical protein LBK53_02990 [Heliobacteriaceae bacterium]|jgi:cell division septation protein DedD|nr:hypothetical protein [Heliobacteriaceae bacterium]
MKKIKKEEQITYEEYKRKPKKKSDESLMLFVSAFFIMLLLFLAVAKHLSPDVDVSIGNPNKPDETSAIDDRLKSLQEADSKPEDTFSPELDEKVKLPSEEKEQLKVIEEKKAEPIQPSPKQQNMSTIQNTQSAKVVVGYYASEEQAQVAKSVISDAGLGLQPFIRNIGGAYTIQAGAFSSYEKAQILVNELLRSNYPARIIME